MITRKLAPCVFFIALLIGNPLISYSQKDTAVGKAEVGKLISQIINNFRRDTTEIDNANDLKRNDEKYIPYSGLIIRYIYIKKLPFGVSFNDSAKKFTNTLISIANSLHHLTRTEVIGKNLFYKENDTINPFIMADNERFLRQLPYVQDAEFTVIPVSRISDSADIIVSVKDVFSLGGSIGSLGLKKSEVEAREDNFAGSGNAVVLYGFYDVNRKDKLSLGGEFIRRNIGGSFINGYIGYKSNDNVFGGPRQERNYFIQLEKPLINRYMKWIYDFRTSFHQSSNRYLNDSLYSTNYRFSYLNIDTWAGYNIRAREFTKKEEASRLRKLVSLRYLNTHFFSVPDRYKQEYFYRFANLQAVLSSISFYRQNFYRTQFIYGFGRNEDIPEGLLMSFTTGYTIKNSLKRPFIGFNYERYHFNSKKNYIGYVIRTEGYLNKKSIEDINILLGITYFDHLKQIGKKWKQRFFLNLDVAQQVNSILNEPLYLHSKFGLPEYGNNLVGGTLRATIKAESVFFSPWAVAAFKIAPFIFSNVSIFSPYTYKTEIYPLIGGGVRTRNESFVFGTVELRGFYFPLKNYYNSRFAISLSTNLIFKYNTQFVNKPDFIIIN
ncbi:MAG: hypothetical protein ABIR31_08670 [Ginsengibacter sp.]